jgi:hypothetical protein
MNNENVVAQCHAARLEAILSVRRLMSRDRILLLHVNSIEILDLGRRRMLKKRAIFFSSSPPYFVK